jgi:hypothetical protein
MLFLGEPQTHGFTLVSTDSYNEELIAEKIKSFGTDARDMLFEATLNNAIIGYGQKNLGVVKIEDKYLEIHDIYQKYGILMNNPPGSTLAEDDLTPNRLMRFFRYDIRDWIKQNNQGSYLWRKYSPREPNMMPTCFRGAEYLEDLTQQQADYLLDSIRNMDRSLGTTMVDRVIRSFDARGQKYSLFPVQGSSTQFTTEQKPRVFHDHPISQEQQSKTGQQQFSGQQQTKTGQQQTTSQPQFSGQQTKTGQQQFSGQQQSKTGQQQSKYTPGQQSKTGQQQSTVQPQSTGQPQSKSVQGQQSKTGLQEGEKKVQSQGQQSKFRSKEVE